MLPSVNSETVTLTLKVLRVPVADSGGGGSDCPHTGKINFLGERYRPILKIARHSTGLRYIIILSDILLVTIALSNVYFTARCYRNAISFVIITAFYFSVSGQVKIFKCVTL